MYLRLTQGRRKHCILKVTLSVLIVSLFVFSFYSNSARFEFGVCLYCCILVAQYCVINVEDIFHSHIQPARFILGSKSETSMSQVGQLHSKAVCEFPFRYTSWSCSLAQWHVQLKTCVATTITLLFLILSVQLACHFASSHFLGGTETAPPHWHT